MQRIYKTQILAGFSLVLLAACGAEEQPTDMIADLLSGGANFEQPISYEQFVAAGDNAPVQDLTGTLRLDTQMKAVGYNVVVDFYDFANNEDMKMFELPPFEFEFVQDGNDFVPVKRGYNTSSHPNWEWVLEPGKVWNDPIVDGGVRVSIPFALGEFNENCLHNGVMMFAVDADGATSDAVYQVSGETCYYFKMDLWGRTGATLTKGDVMGAADIVADFNRRRDARLPVKTISALSELAPNIDLDALKEEGAIKPENLAVYGYVHDGVHYASGCETRMGPYPYCEVMGLPSYSLAKSIVGGLSLMRLEQLYPGVMDRKVVDYVPECAANGGWDEVTFEHLLDMTTGNYNDASTGGDEASGPYQALFSAVTNAQKTDFVCTHFTHQQEPGEHMVYHSSDTYLLGVAMNAFLREKKGPEARFYTDLLIEPIWRKMGLSGATESTRRTYDADAQPFTGWGLILHHDDVARIGLWLARDLGRVDGEDYLNVSELQSALQRDPDDRGLEAYGGSRLYNNGFWASERSSDIGCAGETWISSMSGYGGISVIPLANGDVFYNFSDGGTWGYANALRELNKVNPICGE